MKLGRLGMLTVAFAMIVLIPLTVHAEDGPNATENGAVMDSALKFRRGLINFGFGWTELFAHFNEESFILSAAGNGVKFFAYRTTVGVYETGTFFIPQDPIVTPASPFDRFPQVDE